MGFRAAAALAALILGVCGAAAAQEADRPAVLWFRADYPPNTIVSGPDKDKGAADLRAQIFWRRMPEFDHQWVTAPAKRIVEQLGTVPNACSPILIPTPEREKIMLFSNPVARLLPNGLITSKRHLNRLRPFQREDGAVWLDQALASGTVRVAIWPGRAYGREIDEILTRHAGGPAILANAHSDALLANLLKLRDRDAFEATIAYAIEFRYLADRERLAGGDLIYLPIAEAPPLGHSSFACARSLQGEKVIARVNALLEMPEVQQEIIDTYRSWLPGEAVALYDRLLAAEPAKVAR